MNIISRVSYVYLSVFAHTHIYPDEGLEKN